MKDQEILDRVRDLVAEEHDLRRLHAASETAVDPDRLRRLGEALDQCWDLLRQRRARASSGQNPEEARVRPASRVEGYLQ
ncbi:DUF2630 family protein [Actinomadura sp. 9N407]|uniref:DUF2630 family protein n=1 Tax=Actinomadura sp. 9N407 TaxID=3375154 RepID=UPI00379502F0